MSEFKQKMDEAAKQFEVDGRATSELIALLFVEDYFSPEEQAAIEIDRNVVRIDYGRLDDNDPAIDDIYEAFRNAVITFTITVEQS